MNSIGYICKLSAVILLLSLIHHYSFSQCNAKNSSFQGGERIKMDVYYNFGPIWVKAGKVTFAVDSTIYKGNQVYHLSSTGESLKSYDWIYKVRDTLDAYSLISNLSPLKYIRKTSEGGFNTHNRYYFNYPKKEVYSYRQNSKKKASIDTLRIEENLYDVLTAVYYARTIDFSNLKIKDKVPIKMILDGEATEFYVRYYGKDTITTRTGETYKCDKFKALLIEGSIFSGGEDLTVWVTDDKNRVPLLVEAKILVGSVKAYLSEAEGLRNKETSKIVE